VRGAGDLLDEGSYNLPRIQKGMRLRPRSRQGLHLGAKEVPDRHSTRTSFEQYVWSAPREGLAGDDRRRWEPRGPPARTARSEG